ncbi:STY4528 family pathogenicity island replication protein [Xanthomonas sp. CFBP 8445]|uniref:STY4528 family pathogenicity island replication protein n=1 Tax=Xanthomonas sp. CFBP 8445 TaxID=2971236 RepID=UPI0021E0D6BA|nr:STY4528 family pathogenicity island replication protein [Xanthomonas sp. CFBP 8445]UYC11840.1 STY4528 family pathogenicity island replication protein [Xanthomonas sp. CFBP 8445]
MAAPGMPRPPGPRSLSEVFDAAFDQAQPTPPASGPPIGKPVAQDGFLFSGNRHESVPRGLFLDRRLTPLERNAWQVIRMQLNGDGLTALPTYEQLRPLLAVMPCGPVASTETVARALTLLRLTRWLSLVRRRRDQRSGRIMGNLYVLHDAPLTPFEAMQLDADYLGLVSQALTHASKAVQSVGQHVLQEVADDPMLRGGVLPTRLQVLTAQLADGAQKPQTQGESYPQDAHAGDSEAGRASLLRISDPPSSDSESGRKPAPERSLRNPKEARTGSFRIGERTVLRERARDGLRLPAEFLSLKDEQQSGALVALGQVAEEQRQAVVDEWAARCRDSAVRNPAGYLFGLIQRAMRGEFKPWAGAGAGKSPAPDTPPPPPRPPPPPPAPAPKPASPEVARAHLERLRAILRGG